MGTSGAIPTPDAEACPRFASSCCAPSASATPRRDRPVILFLEKNNSMAEHKCTVGNMDEVEMTGHRFPSVVVRRRVWGAVEEQYIARAMQDVDVLVSMPGSDIMAGCT